VLLHGTDLRIGFSAHALARQDRNIGGRIALDLRDGLAPVAFEPLLGALVPEVATGPGYIVILMALNDAPPELENLVVAVVRPDPALPGCDIWDFSSNGVSTGRSRPLRLSFHAEGAIHVVRGAP
jgi:hypothetical protein